jgi:signal transduction histidine kinase
LRLSKSDHQRLHKKPVALNEIVNEVINGLIDSIQAKEINIDDAVPNITVTCDRESIVQAVTILLDNAIKYSPVGATITLAGEGTAAHSTLSIIDHGVGIDGDDLPHIFERFYRAKNSGQHSIHGYGLGLSIAQKLISQNGGKIKVVSSVGKGSTFTIKLSSKVS